MNRFLLQSKAEVVRTLRNKFFVMFSILMPVVFYFIFTSVVGDETIVRGSEWKAFYLMSMTAFSVIGAAISTLGIRLSQERQQGWVSLLNTTPLPYSIYILAKMVAQSVLNIVIITVLFLVGGFAKSIDLSAAQWILSALWIWIGVLPFLAMGVWVGSFKNTEATIAASSVLHMGMAILGGLWMPLETMPQWIQNIGLWLPSYHYGQGAWGILAGEAPSLSILLILFAYLLVFIVLSVYNMKRQEAV
jgi:ABC-2 type transport system permease protein